jgi:hypothetical protein
MSSGAADSGLIHRLANGGYDDICIELSQYGWLSEFAAAGGPSPCCIPPTVFCIPSFTERFHGIAHDSDISSSFVAFPAFVLHSLNSIRLASIVLYASASLPRELRKSGSVMEPFIDLGMRLNLLARGVDHGVNEHWHMAVSGIIDIAAWWERQCRIPGEAGEAGGAGGAAGAAAVPIRLGCMVRLNEWCSDMMAGKVDAVAGFRPDEWTFMNLLCSSLVAETSRLLAAAGTIGATHLLDIPHESNTIQRKAWRLSWDANMFTLRKIHAYATLTSVSQYEGIGAHETDPGKVYMPRFDGTVASQLLSAIDQIVSETHSGGLSFAYMARLSTPIPVDTVDEMCAYHFCRRGFLILLMRLADLRDAQEAVPLSLRTYMPLLQWDILVAGKGMSIQSQRLEGCIDLGAAPQWMPLGVCVKEEDDKTVKYEYPHGGVHLSSHLVEFIRPVAYPYKHKPRRSIEGKGRSFEGQVRSYIVNPVTWGPLGTTRERD